MNINLKTMLSKLPKSAKGVIIIIGIILIVLLGLFVNNLFSSKRMIYIDIQNYPEEWRAKYGIGKSHIKESIIENFDDLESSANTKLEDILNERYGKSTDPNSKEQLADDEVSFPLEIYVFNSDVAKLKHQIEKKIRRILKKEDVWVNLRITEFEDNLKAKIVTTDWDDNIRNKQLTIDKSDYKNNIENSINALFMDIAALIYGIHHPIASVLYDYNIVDEYQGVSPWNNSLYTEEEKDNILLNYAQSDNSDSSFGYLLLGSINEKMGDESKDGLLEKLNKSKTYYNTYLERDTTFKNIITNKISIIEEHIANIINGTGNEETIHINGTKDIYELEKKGIIRVDSNTCQLVIVTDPISYKKQTNGGKRGFIHKAKMSFYERDYNGEWEQVLYNEPIDVNLSYNGLIPEKKKKEGDGCVPAGYFPIPLAFGFKDIDTKMKYKVVGEKDYWVSNPQSRFYNTLQKESDKEFHDGMSERLANITLYEYAVVVGYNMNPIKKGAGSAIFIHISRSKDAVTSGCLAIEKEQLINLIKWLDSSKNPHIYIGKMPD